MRPWARWVKETPLVRLSALRRARRGKPRLRGALAHFFEGKRFPFPAVFPGVQPGCRWEKGFPFLPSSRMYNRAVSGRSRAPGAVRWTRGRKGEDFTPRQTPAFLRGIRIPEVPRGAAASRRTGCPVRREAADGGIALPAVRRGGGRMPTGARAVSPTRWCGAAYDQNASVAPLRTVRGSRPLRPLPGAGSGPTCGPP